MRQTFDVRRKVANSEDALHCVQAAFAMAVETLTDIKIDIAESELLTGFREGVETWPYQMLAWFAVNGFDVVHVDALDAASLASDPRAELTKSGLDSSTIEYFFEISDFDAEAAAINRCIDSGVSFHTRIPGISDIADGLSHGWLPIVSLDASVLTKEAREGFQGHIVLVTGTDTTEDLYQVQDSGPPARWDWNVPGDRIVAAMRTPTESSGTVSLVRARQS